MIDTKERLAELLGYYMPPIDRNRCMPYLKGECNGLCAECTVKFLVDNGVTINEWIPVGERLPETEKRVLVAITRHSEYTGKDFHLTTCAIYEDGNVNVEDSCWMCEDGYYDEESDITYVPKGWYEFHEYGNIEEDGIGLIGWDNCLIDEVTHWMPLPELPKGE